MRGPDDTLRANRPLGEARPAGDDPADPPFRSPFGGLWTDRTDAEDIAADMLRRGAVDEPEHEGLLHFIRNGFLVLPGAVSRDRIAALDADLDRVFSGEMPRRMTFWDDAGLQNVAAAREHLAARESKLLDLHGVSPAAHALIFAPPVLRYLELIFGEPPLAFQSLYFQYGSQQGIHQDSAFVPVADAPLEFAATWIALEDIAAGSGELLYVPGSHRLKDLTFADGGKQCRPDDPRINRYVDLVREHYGAAGLEPAAFLPGQGDVLIWAADLAHGGAPITTPGATRRSLVTHYCPLSRRPEYALHSDAQVRPTPAGGHVISRT